MLTTIAVHKYLPNLSYCLFYASSKYTISKLLDISCVTGPTLKMFKQKLPVFHSRLIPFCFVVAVVPKHVLSSNIPYAILFPCPTSSTCLAKKLLVFFSTLLKTQLPFFLCFSPVIVKCPSLKPDILPPKFPFHTCLVYCWYCFILDWAIFFNLYHPQDALFYL